MRCGTNFVHLFDLGTIGAFVAEPLQWQIKTTLLLAEQLITCLERLHEFGYVHGNVKPGNFVMGLGDKKSKVFTINLDSSSRYLDDDISRVVMIWKVWVTCLCNSALVFYHAPTRVTLPRAKYLPKNSCFWLVLRRFPLDTSVSAGAERWQNKEQLANDVKVYSFKIE